MEKQMDELEEENKRLIALCTNLAGRVEELEEESKPKPRKPRKPRKHKDPRVTVLYTEDKKEYNRQVNYIKLHPDCEFVIARKHHHIDPRVTVQNKTDRNEYNRQVMYLKANPDCESVPPRSWTCSKKNGSL